MRNICCSIYCTALAVLYVVCGQTASSNRGGDEVNTGSVTPEAGGSDDVSVGLWSPDDGVTRADWLRCYGMPCDTFLAVTRKEKQLRRILARIHGVPVSDIEDSNPKALQEPFEPVMLTEEQLDIMIDSLEVELASRNGTEHTNHRVKRKVRKFNEAFRKWEDARMVYKFDGEHKESEREKIRGAMRHWEANTCIRFEEKATKEKVKIHHVLFTRQSTGCYSYVGRMRTIPQQINLHSTCLPEFGTPVHEIGHALGLWHEHQRSDRDAHVKINWENISSYRPWFNPENTRSLGVPYDFGSVMHYRSTTGSTNGKPSIEARDPWFTSSMGQKSGLSFYDAMIINKAYCGHVCSGLDLSRACAHGGYQDPNDCSSCRCPDGWGGNHCEKVQHSKGEPCGGRYYVEQAGMVIFSPGYRKPGHYNVHQECNWLLKAPAGYRLLLRFEGRFGVMWAYGASCYHWVEVRYQQGLDQQGPRFCGGETPRNVVVSESHEMMVIFRANFTASNLDMRGFKAKVLPVPNDDAYNGRPKMTTTSANVKRITPTTATVTANVTVVPNSSGLKWRCDFEIDLCDMMQASDDDFDWTRWTRATPSSLTGPGGAASGHHYLYIEASSPRKRNDRAVIYTPKLGYSGSACVRVSVHMYGFHVNQLLMVKKSGSNSQVIWSVTGQQGNYWFSASQSVDLLPDDKIGFVGVRGSEYSGDIGIDNVIITSQDC